jgi:hypothetical protein
MIVQAVKEKEAETSESMQWPLSLNIANVCNASPF